MAMNTRGTQLFMYDKKNSKVVELGCPTGLGSLSGTRDVQETGACLKDGKATKFTGGINWDNFEPTLNFDTSDPSHILAWNMFVDGTEDIPFIVLFSNGTSDPAWTSGWDDISSNRSAITFTGAFSGAGIEFADAGSAVGGSLSIIVNDPELIPKA